MRKLLQKAVNSVMESGNTDLRWAPHYAEPGYSCGDDGVFMGNWNTRRERNPVTGYYDGPEVRTPESRLGALLEREGVDLEWCDEWTTCCSCFGAIRTQPDGWGWTPSYVWADECTILCLECASQSDDDDDDEVSRDTEDRRAFEPAYDGRCGCGAPTVGGLHWWGWQACQNYRRDRRGE